MMSTASATRRVPPLACAGLDALVWLRFVDDADGLTCEAHGVRRRHPAVVSIPVPTGLELVRRGVPAVMRRAG